MNEQGVISNARDVGPPADVERASESGGAASGYGARLAWQRQSAGLGVTDVAAQLRLHPNQVRAIEQEDLSRLPAPAYVRGFIRGYARVLNMDPAPLLNDLNAKLEPAPEAAVDNTATDFSAARAAGRERVFPQWMIGIALLILLALGVVGWQATQQPEPAPPPQAAQVPVTQSPPPAPTTRTAVTAPTSEAAPAAAADPVPAPAEVAEPTVASSVIASGAAPTLLLKFSGASWTEVTDRSGKILLSQLNTAGAEHALDGDLPLTVVIGDANFAAVEVRGAAFNLQPFIRNNVARFTIK